MLPLIIGFREVGEDDLCGWARANAAHLHQLLVTHGALLFRDFPRASVEQFQNLVTLLLGSPLAYTERSSPRSKVTDRVYTSTEYPPDREIFLHNEQSYNLNFPRYIAFFCRVAAPRGGETPLGDSRRVLARIAPSLRDELVKRRYRYVRNYGGRLRMSWQEAFGADVADHVEQYCNSNDIQYEWLDRRGGAHLRTSQTRSVTARHPISQGSVWFNHLVFFHRSNLDLDLRSLLDELHGPDGAPHATFFGDGAVIEDPLIAQLREAYRAEEVLFDWRIGDILLVDNMLVSHGRRPFAGNRSILVAMAGPCSWSEVAIGDPSVRSDGAPQRRE